MRRVSTQPARLAQRTGCARRGDPERFKRNLGSTVQTGALGGGWSDITSASKWDDPVIGEYVTGNSTRGIRFYSMASSPLEYSNLCNVASGCEVHADGEIWTAAFWDMRTKLVARYGDPAGKTLAFQLIVDGMKNTAKNPTFLSARDGILAADVTDKSGADTCNLGRVRGASDGLLGHDERERRHEPSRRQGRPVLVCRSPRSGRTACTQSG